MKITDIERWRVEIDLSEKFIRENFGSYTKDDHEKVGVNIDYFERGFEALTSAVGDADMLATLNLIHAIVKNIVPAISYKNPMILATPKKAESQDTAPIVAQTMNHFYRHIEVEEINDDVVWDTYVLGHGYTKVGYTTKFGMDVPDEKKKKNAIDRGLEALGMKKKEEEPVIRPELDMEILSEDPYIRYVSPFDFLRDVRAKNLKECMWVGERFRKSVKSMKLNKRYKNTSKLNGSEPDIEGVGLTKVSQSEIEDFRFVDLYVILYRNDDKIYELVISKDNDEYAEHYHEECPYQINGWQYDELTFNKHPHKAFAISDITKLRNLQDRFTSTMDAILEQVDRFVPKIAYNGSDVTTEGKAALRDGDIGALVETTKNPNEVFKELQFTQLKQDLKQLLEHFIDLVSILTGLTRAQIMGIASGETATSEAIAQGGYTLRINDLNKKFNRFAKKQATKLWQVVQQFVDLEELQLINGQSGIDESGNPVYNWLLISPDQAQKMRMGNYEIDIEVGSTQKNDLGQLRKQFENLFSILARTDVVMLMQQQGDKLNLSELLKMYMNLFPEAVKDVGRVLQKITPATQGLLPPEIQEARGGTTPGSNFNALEKQASEPGVPNANQYIRM